jgi:hypothetical protein
MLASDIANGFPTGVVMPADLVALCAFAEEHNGNTSGLFEFCSNGAFSAECWFGDKELASKFAVFGQGPDGSLYALWMHVGPEAEKAPIVYLDSEGCGSKVIADNMREFLRLLAIGYDEPRRYPTLEPRMAESASELRKWLNAKYRLAPPKIGSEIVSNSQQRHPDLEKWIQAERNKKP